jgi:hypothetical protein
LCGGAGAGDIGEAGMVFRSRFRFLCYNFLSLF